MMATTLSGHPALTPGDRRLKSGPVPGRPVTIRAHHAALPLMLRASVLFDRVCQIRVADSGSYAYRQPRTSSTGPMSDHCGWAMDHWSARIGREGFPAKMRANQAAQISQILLKFHTADDRLVFGWGASDQSPGVDYPITYSRLSDPMHFYVAPGITVTDLKAVRARMRINTDGTIG